jgi:ATP diphosphatase
MPTSDDQDGWILGPARDIARLIEIMAALRTPVTGCPWDLEQNFKTIAPYTIEEAYEVADAIERGDLADLKEELGDLLLQSVYHAQMASEQGAFDFGDVVHTVTTKMIRRHPHVFGDEAARSAGAAKDFWEKIKAEEKAEKAQERARLGLTPKDAQASVLGDVPRGLPGLTRAMKLQDKAARVGFDWPDLKPVLAKVREEVGELEEAISSGDKTAAAEELGDILFVLANVARHLAIEPETALRRTNEKFIRRFQAVERALAANGKTPQQSTLEEMDALWDAAKIDERKGD